MSCLQSQAAKSPPQKYHGHSSSRVGPPQLFVSGAWGGAGRKCSGNYTPFHQICPGLCHKDPNHPNDCYTLWDKLIVHYGLPKKILTDQGHNIESQLVADLCKLMGTQKVQTSPYHLQSNSQCKRFNSTLINMPGMLPKEKKSRVEKPHWNIGPCIQLYPKLSHGVQPLISHVWETASPPYQCNPWSGSTDHLGAKYHQNLQKIKECTWWAHKKLKHFKQKRHNIINATMINEVGQWPWESGTQL